MERLTKQKRKIAKELLRTGILRRHAEWLKEIRDMIDRRLKNGDNEFSISMDVTKSSKDFFKEAIKMEDYYRTRWIEFGLRYLYYNHYLTDEEISVLPPEIISFIHT